MDKFSYYDILGVIAPGTVFLAGLLLLFGNLQSVRFWDGMPSDWVRTGRHEHLPLSDSQVNQLTEVCTSKLGLSIDCPLQDLSSAEWDGITSQIHAAVDAEGRAQRISTFNSNYGFHRGLTVSLFLLAIASVVAGRMITGIASGLGGLITLYRMHRFACHYGRELFVQALQLPIKE